MSHTVQPAIISVEDEGVSSPRMQRVPEGGPEKTPRDGMPPPKLPEVLPDPLKNLGKRKKSVSPPKTMK